MDSGRIAMLGVGATLLVGFIPLLIYLDQLEQDKKDAVPKIEFLDAREQDGYVYVTLKNTSPKTFANITGISYKISKPELLSQIARVYPVPPPPKPHRLDKNAKCGAMANADDVFFKNGYWCEGAYFYDAKVSLNLPIAGQGSDLKLAIIDRSLAGKKMIGRLEIYYDGDESVGGDFALKNVRVPVRRSQ